MIIREIEKRDYDEWRALWKSYLAFYNTTVSQDVYELTFRRLIERQTSQQMAFLAEKDDQLVGLVHYIRHPHNWKLEHVIYLQDLFALPEVRGQGVGRALIEAVYDAADKMGCPSVYWLTQENNETARRLYDRVATVSDFIKYNR